MPSGAVLTAAECRVALRAARAAIAQIDGAPAAARALDDWQARRAEYAALVARLETALNRKGD